MTEFTPEWIAGAREVVGNDAASPSGQIAFIALDHIERLQKRVQELEVEGKQVCESTIFEQDYQTWNGDWESAYRCRTGCGVQQKISSDTCHDCGKRIKYTGSEE